MNILVLFLIGFLFGKYFESIIESIVQIINSFFGLIYMKLKYFIEKTHKDIENLDKKSSSSTIGFNEK